MTQRCRNGSWPSCGSILVDGTGWNVDNFSPIAATREEKRVATKTITPESTMSEVLEAFPGAKRALFRAYHIGG